MLRTYEEELEIPAIAGHCGLLPYLAGMVRRHLRPGLPGQLHRVENYWEAAGVMSALKAGIAPGSVRRPLADTVHVRRSNP